MRALTRPLVDRIMQRYRILRILRDESIDRGVHTAFVDSIGSKSRNNSILLDIALDGEIAPDICERAASQAGAWINDSTKNRLFRILRNESIDRGVHTAFVNGVGSVSRNNSILLDIALDREIAPDICERAASRAGAMINSSTQDHIFRIMRDESIDRDMRNALADGVSQSCNDASILLDLVAEEKIEPDIRERAASHAGAMINSSTQDRLFRILHDESIDRGVRNTLADGVSQSCNDASILLGLVAEEKIEPDIRERAASCVGKWIYSSTKDHLFRILHDESIDRDIRNSLANHVSQSCNDASVLLGLVAENKSDLDIRKRAASRVGKWIYSSTKDRLFCILRDKSVDRGVRNTLADGVSQSCNDASVLLDLVAENKFDLDIRERAASRASKWINSSTKDRLFRILRDKNINRGVRNTLANGVSQSCNDASVLLDLIAENKFDLDIRERAASRAGKWIKSSTKDRLFRILRDKSIDRGVRNTLANGVSQSCNDASVLLDLIAENKFDLDIRERAASRAGKWIKSSTKDRLFRILRDKSIDRGIVTILLLMVLVNHAMMHRFY